ncbi:MAG: MbcA/ParS/Xre antitoxin family protein [Acidimicrobiales bacterium]
MFVVDRLGVRSVARLLGVSPSQPSRWRTGAELPGPGTARRLLDLDHVLAQLVQVWPAEVAEDWLTTANPHLEGATPAEVLEVRGSAEVIDALRADAEGAFS